MASVRGEPRVSADGRVEFDVATGEPGTTQVLVSHGGGTEVALCTVMVTADTRGLAAQIAAADGLASTDYTATSWAPVLPALEAAKDVLAATAVAQAQVDAAANELAAALAGLVRRDAVTSAPYDVVATASGTLVQVQWSAPESTGGSPIIAYEIAVGDRVVQSEASARSAAVSGVEPGEHIVTVRAQNTGGWSALSAPITVVVDPEAVAPVVRVEGTPTAGGRIDVTGSGFEPGVEYVIQLRSTPVDLGTAAADGDGAIAFRGTVPADVAAGDHTLVVMLGTADVASTPVRILAADPGTPGTPGPGSGPGTGTDGSGVLPGTGGDLAWLPWSLGIAVLLLLAGAAAVRVRRGRTD